MSFTFLSSLSMNIYHKKIRLYTLLVIKLQSIHTSLDRVDLSGTPFKFLFTNIHVKKEVDLQAISLLKLFPIIPV